MQFSPQSLALQGFAEALQKVAPSKISSHSRSGIEIRVLDVIPLPLETVFVTIEGDLINDWVRGSKREDDMWIIAERKVEERRQSQGSGKQY